MSLEYRPPIEHNARTSLNQAVKRGKVLRPDWCERCGAQGKVQGHHQDYTKRLEVDWLCARCHSDEHVRLRRAIREAQGEP